MAIALLDAASTGQGGTGTTLTIEHTVSAGSDLCLIAGCGAEGSEAATDITGITWNGTPMTLGAKTKYSGVNNSCGVFYLLDPDIGTHDLVITFNVGVDATARNGGVLTLSGVSGAEDTGDVATGSSTTSSVTVTPITANAWIIDVASNSASSFDMTPASGQTERWENTFGMRLVCGTLAVVSPAPTNIDWTFTSRAWGAVGIALTPAGVAVAEDYSNFRSLTGVGI